MTNLIVITFSNEAKALDGSHKLSELESFGDISIFEKVMVKKDANGNVTILQADTTEGLRTLSGMAIGSIIGALGGPVGLLVGMLAGTVTGTYWNQTILISQKILERKLINGCNPEQ